MNIIPTKTCPVCKGEGVLVTEPEPNVTLMMDCKRCFGRRVVMIDTVEGAP